MIKMQNIALRRGSQLLFENVSRNIYPGEKIGLIGDNGSGKSSLFAAQYRQQLKPQRDRVKNLERKMQKIQQDIQSLDTILNDPNTYQTQSTAELAGMIQEKES